MFSHCEASSFARGSRSLRSTDEAACGSERGASGNGVSPTVVARLDIDIAIDVDITIEVCV